MIDRLPVVWIGSRHIHVVLWLLTLVLASGCGRAAYDQKLESRIQQLRSQTPAEEQTEEAAAPPDEAADASDADAEPEAEAEAEENPFDGGTVDESSGESPDESAEATAEADAADENADAANQ